jgi:hypothetical protein
MTEGNNEEMEKSERIFLEKSEGVRDLTKAMVPMLGEIKNAPTTKQGYGYMYAPLSEILDAIRPILSKHGFSVMQLVSTTDGNTIAVKTILMHSTGQYISSVMELPPTDVKGTVQIQKMGASISYARRYMISSMLGIAGEEDTDGVTHAKSGADNSRMKEPPKVAPKAKAPSPESVQTPKDIDGKISSATKMINTLINDNESKLGGENVNKFERDLVDIADKEVKQERYLAYRGLYSQIQETLKAIAKDEK